MEEKYEHILIQAYDFFNKRNIDEVLRLMTNDVLRPNGWEGGYVNGVDEVRKYWTRQWQQLNPKVEPLSFKKLNDGRIEVLVHQLVLNMQNGIIFDGQVLHIYSFRNEKVSHMEIKEA